MVEKEIQMAVNYLKTSTYSNYQIARKTGISQPSIAKYRQGTSIPGLANAKAIVSYFSRLEEFGQEPEPAELTDMQRLFEALERRDAQVQDMLDQQRRLIAIIARMQGVAVTKADAADFAQGDVVTAEPARKKRATGSAVVAEPARKKRVAGAEKPKKRGPQKRVTTKK